VKDTKELDLGDWMKAWRVMERIGIKTVKIMGGEPTVKKWLPDLLRFASRTEIKTAILSNSTFDDETRRRIADSLPWGYFASVDCLEDLQVNKDPVKKSLNGYNMLRKFKNSAIQILAANVVINKHNIHEIPEIVRRLSDEGFYINLCMVQHTKDESREFSKTTIKQDYLFTDGDVYELSILRDTLVDMKKNGCRISVPYSYIEGIVDYGIHCNWKCTDQVQLRVDSDGGLMLCNEYRTKLADNYNILKMTPEKYEEFLSQWHTARKHVDCKGCYWSCFIQAKDNIENNRLEFHYAA
jgi:MoaA/NifB/PqqE/SkfB family radical SAM enzyme